MSKQYAKRPPARRKRASTPLAAWLLVGGGLALLAVVAVLAWPKTIKAQIEVTGAPKLKVDRDKVDLGNITLGQTVEVSFQLTNVGDQPLRIAQAPFVEVVEGCWPPTPTVGAMVIQPGGSTQLSLKFMMHGDMGGKHLFRVHVPTNDPTQPEAALDVASNWVP